MSKEQYRTLLGLFVTGFLSLFILGMSSFVMLVGPGGMNRPGILGGSIP